MRNKVNSEENHQLGQCKPDEMCPGGHKLDAMLRNISMINKVITDKNWSVSITKFP